MIRAEAERRVLSGVVNEMISDGKPPLTDSQLDYLATQITNQLVKKAIGLLERLAEKLDA